ncbi:hypothetical protein I79_004380 [Cricetulus griseus]|uniref:Uncharacterized protein n=1 Tax=Cricetulus griseus TaxID=10029 RepID=G3H2G7_CRIGR|nr:hypothetical protein I79_004380 [Cricetulus griseus]
MYCALTRKQNGEKQSEAFKWTETDIPKRSLYPSGLFVLLYKSVLTQTTVCACMSASTCICGGQGSCQAPLEELYICFRHVR